MTDAPKEQERPEKPPKTFTEPVIEHGNKDADPRTIIRGD